MKKYLLLLASAALLLVGCAKEKLSIESGADEMVTATFTAQMQSAPQTKAVTDGGGTKANRCVMEIYYGGELYLRDVQSVSGMKATFTPTLVSNRTYDVLFWADCGGENLADKYYKTNAVDLGLQAVEMKAIAYAANDDARDAFFAKERVEVLQQVSTKEFELTRPFSQVNIITTDAAIIKNDNLYPDGVKMVYTAPTKFNLLSGELSEAKELTVTGTPYEDFDATSAALTLEMDYLFAGMEKSALDIAFEASKTGETNVTKHSFTNIPVQRNYRTNIKGKLLTTTGQWTVTVDPIWGDPDYTHPVVIATTLAEAQAAVGPTATGAEAAGTVIVKPEAIANRTADDVKGKSYVEAKTTGINLPEGAKAIEFVLTQQSKKDVTFELPALPDANFYWYIRHEEGYPTENLNVKVDDDDATRVIIDAPNNTHVVLNDVEYSHVIAITGDNTLVVPQGIKVDKLTVKKGGVEIHGTVTELEVAPETGKNVYFRECEGLSVTVFEKIYKAGEYNYIDSWYTYELVDGKYNIYKLPVVAKIGENLYKSIEDAVAAVQANQTIEIISDIALDSPITISKSNFTIDGKNKTIAVSDAEYWNQYKIGGANQGLGKVNMISVTGSKFTLKDITLDGKDCRGVSLCTTSGGKDVLYQNVIYTGRGSGHYYGEAAGLVTFDGCKFDIHGYAVHFGGETSLDDDVVIKNCELNGWSSFGACKSLTISDSHFGGANDEGKNGWLAVLRPYCPTTITNCTFSDIYLHEDETGYECIGLGTGAATTVTLNGCKVVNDSKQETGDAIYSIVRDNGFNEDDPNAQLQSVFAFDATGNATDGYSAGTFYAKQASNIKAAQGFKIVAVEGKDNIWTTAPVEYKTTLLCNGELFGQYETIADAVKAFNFDENITAGDYILNIKPGTYNEDMILFIQDKTEGKYRTLLVQSADPAQKVVVKSTSAMKAVFGIAAESDYSGGPISFKNIDIDVSGNTNSNTYPIYFAGSQSGKPDLIFPEPSTNYNRRYGHDISFDNCNIIGNGTSQAFVGSTGTGAIKVENCTISNCSYGFAGYYVLNPGHTTFGLHIKNVTFNGGTFINDESGGNSEIVVEGCEINSNSDYVIRTSGGKLILNNCDHQLVIKDTEIIVDGAYMGDSRGVIYFRTSETHALIDNCTITKKNLTQKDETCILYDIYNKDTTVTINGKNLPSGSLVNLNWLTETE